MPGTRLVNKRDLSRQFAVEPKRATSQLLEAIDKGLLCFDDFSIKELAESVIKNGDEYVAMMDPNHPTDSVDEIMESEMVDTKVFSLITKQLIFNMMLEGFNLDEYNVIRPLIQSVPTKFNGESIPGVTGLGDVAKIVGEGKEYGRAGVSEDWVKTAMTEKRGLIVDITKEILFFDQTGLVSEQSSKVGEAMGLNLEKRAIDCAIDMTTIGTAHRYNWKGTVIATYGDNSGSHTWDNLSASTPLVNWKSVATVEKLMALITDPYTGEPVAISPTHLLCGTELIYDARRIINATQITYGAGGSTSTSESVAQSANPLNNNPFTGAAYKIVSSRLIGSRLNTNTDWFLINWRAFRRMVNWDIRVEKNEQLDQAFTRDIVVSFKGSERSVFATLEPRLCARATA